MTMRNKLKIKNVAFLEFAGSLTQLDELFTQFCFEKTVNTKKALHAYYQGEMFLIVDQSRTQERPVIRRVVLHVENCEEAYRIAIENGAKDAAHMMHYDLKGIQGVGDCDFFFVDDEKLQEIRQSFGFENHKGDQILQKIDHLAFNIDKQNQQAYFRFLEDVFGFEALKDFAIKGEITSFETTPFRLEGTDLCFVLSRSDDPKSQISTYLERHEGEGLQHVAFDAKSIFEAVDRLRDKGIAFQETPDAYYDDLPKRVSKHGESLKALKERGVLIDGDDKAQKYLLQIFTKEILGPIFFELIERRGEKSLGEGNITALFKSIEAAA